MVVSAVYITAYIVSYIKSIYFFIFQADDISAIQSQVCPQADQSCVQVSVDGVKECRSTSVSIDVYTSRLTNCRMVFPHRIIRPLGKYKGIDNTHQLNTVINDIRNFKRITQLIADSQKRSVCKNTLGHSSYFPCEYCFARGVAVATGNNNKKKITWPASTANAEPRTATKIREIVNRLESDEQLTPLEKKGVKGRSIFLDMDVDNFCYVRDIPAEYLHSSCLGLIKKLVELTFALGESRSRITNRPLTKPSVFNALMAFIKSPREFSRRARDLDFAVFKGAEFRNLALFYFPIINQCIEEGEGERKLWLYLAYMLRACVIPDCEYSHVNKQDILDCCKNFYELYEELFGKTNCTYNTHVVCGHMLDMRASGPLTYTSAFGFESFYGELRQSFVAGTVSPLKQIMQQVFLKRMLAPHSCELPIYYSTRSTSLENNSLIYCWNNNMHSIYLIKEMQNETFTCLEYEKKNVSDFQEVPGLDWSVVGVYEKGDLKENEVFIEKDNICGKVLEVDKYLITCPNNVLREK